VIVRSRTAVVGTEVGRIAVAGIVADHTVVVGTAVVVSTGMVVGQTVAVVVAHRTVVADLGYNSWVRTSIVL